MGSADMVQDSVGISLFATKNKVKREGGGWVGLGWEDDTHSQLKWRYIPQIQNNERRPAGRIRIPNVEVELRNILIRQIRYRTSLEHSLPGTSTGLIEGSKITKFSPLCQVFVELLGHKASNSEISKVGEGRKFRNTAEESEWQYVDEITGGGMTPRTLDPRAKNLKIGTFHGIQLAVKTFLVIRRRDPILH